MGGESSVFNEISFPSLSWRLIVPCCQSWGTPSTRAHFIKCHFGPHFTLWPALPMQRKQTARCSLCLLPQQRFIHYSKKKPTQTKLPGTHSKPSTPSLVCPATGQSAGLSSAHFWCLPIISQPSLLLSPSPSSQACWNLNFKWTPSMATIDRKGAFDCSCIAEKKGGGSSWLRPSRNSSSTAPQPLQWDAFACSYSFKLPASMFPFKEDKFFRFPLLRN